ncbi:MAG TPA: O-antigen ligase family protein, partial [Chloroflexia bacterium]|nr:O-antigen ligase family protein [Chloroflexia bacterium]
MATVRDSWRDNGAWRNLAIGAGALALGALGGVAAAATNPLIPFALLLAVLPLPWLLTRPQVDLALAVGVIIILPFGTLPLKIGFTPTLLELALLLLAGVGLFAQARAADSHWRGLVRTPLDGWVLLFLGVISFAFVLGLARDASTEIIHNYVKLLLAITFFFTAGQVLRTPAAVLTLVRVIVGAGGLAALVGLVLWRLPQATAERLLLLLRPLGYPTSGVLRFVEDGPGLGQERAIGTSVDPNSFAGLLVVLFALTLTQLLGRRPLFPRPLLGGILLTQTAALLLTQSRTAWVAAAMAAGVVGALRYRKFAVAGLIAVTLLLASGLGGAYVARFVSGVQLQDQAQVMRLNEFQNAGAVIARYPFFGVGFGTAGELDLTTGVSSLYLTITERTGLLGMGVFAVTVGLFLVLLAPWLRARPGLSDTAAALDATLLGTVAAVMAVLVVGLADHYYFNIEQPHLAALFWLCL